MANICTVESVFLYTIKNPPTSRLSTCLLCPLWHQFLFGCDSHVLWILKHKCFPSGKLVKKVMHICRGRTKMSISVILWEKFYFEKIRQTKNFLFLANLKVSQIFAKIFFVFFFLIFLVVRRQFFIQYRYTQATIHNNRAGYATILSRQCDHVFRAQSCL